MRRTIPQMPAYLAWAEQAPQYERPDITNRSPGTHYWRVPPELVEGIHIDVLLHYDGTGLVGILTHYPNGTYMADHPGDVTLVVHPGRQRQGIGTTLLREAVSRWSINLDNQCTTPAGRALIAAFQKGTSHATVTPD